MSIKIQYFIVSNDTVSNDKILYFLHQVSAFTCLYFTIFQYILLNVYYLCSVYYSIIIHPTSEQ